jgi:hypothetical protein
MRIGSCRRLAFYRGPIPSNADLPALRAWVHPAENQFQHCDRTGERPGYQASFLYFNIGGRGSSPWLKPGDSAAKNLLTEAKWRGKLKRGLLLEVFGLSQDELKAPHTDSSGEERLGCAASTSPITRSQALDPSSEPVEIQANRVGNGSRPPGG